MIKNVSKCFYVAKLNRAEWATTPLFGQSGGGVQWWISVLGLEDNVMKKNNLFIYSLVDILDCAEKEKMQYLMGKSHCGI